MYNLLFRCRMGRHTHNSSTCPNSGAKEIQHPQTQKNYLCIIFQSISPYIMIEPIKTWQPTLPDSKFQTQRFFIAAFLCYKLKLLQLQRSVSQSACMKKSLAESTQVMLMVQKIIERSIRALKKTAANTIFFNNEENKSLCFCHTACVQGWLWMRLRSSWALSFRSGLLSVCSVDRDSCSCSRLFDDIQSQRSLSGTITQTQAVFY